MESFHAQASRIFAKIRPPIEAARPSVDQIVPRRIRRFKDSRGGLAGGSDSGDVSIKAVSKGLSALRIALASDEAGVSAVR